MGARVADDRTAAGAGRVSILPQMLQVFGAK
jgi:hypothetical protein